MTREYILQKNPRFWWNIWLNSKSGLDFDIYGGFKGVEFLYDGDPVAVISNVGSSTSFRDTFTSKTKVVTRIHFYVDRIFTFKPSFIYNEISDCAMAEVDFSGETLLEVDPCSSKEEVNHILFLMALCGAPE